jgi:hypothetical protein
MTASLNQRGFLPVRGSSGDGAPNRRLIPLPDR